MWSFVGYVQIGVVTNTNQALQFYQIKCLDPVFLPITATLIINNIILTPDKCVLLCRAELSGSKDEKLENKVTTTKVMTPITEVPSSLCGW